MRTLLTRTLASVLLTVAVAAAAGAQSPTPEGTVITSTATATFTDANGNSYANVTANVAVTVGFQAAVDAQSPASQSPVAGSTGNSVVVTIVNDGNGTDQFTLAATPPSGVTLTGFVFNGTPYASLAALNAALQAANVAAGASEQVTVEYSVAAGNTGTGNLAFTATSVRTTTVTDVATTVLNYQAQAIVDVTAGAATSSRLPSATAAQTYTQTFTVANTGSASGDFTLSVTTNANITNATLSAPTVTLAPGANQVVTVTYNVLSSAAIGATGTITLTATHTTTPSITDNALHTVTVIRPQLAMTKAAFRADGTTPITAADRVLPGEIITYRIAITNSGSAEAATVSISDVLPAEVTYQAASLTPDATGWTLNEAAGTITGALATLPTATTRFFTFRVTVK